MKQGTGARELYSDGYELSSYLYVLWAPHVWPQDVPQDQVGNPGKADQE